MEYKATLKLRKPQKDNIQGLYFENYDVLHCEYSFHKQMSKYGEAQSDMLGGNIHIALPMLPSEELLGWVFDTQKLLNGEIVINDMHEELLEKVYFEQARCVEFRLHYEPGDTTNVVLLLTVNAQRMIIGDVEYKNSWR